MLFAETDWVGLAEKGLTSAFFAVAFGFALWRIGNKLLDSHLTLVANANAKLDVAVDELRRGNVISEKIADKIDNWPSDANKLCKVNAEEIVERVKDAMAKDGLTCEAHLIEKVLTTKGLLPKKAASHD